MKKITIYLLMFIGILCWLPLIHAAEQKPTILPILSLLLSSSDGGSGENCDTSYLSLCTTESTCNGASGYWYDESCNADEQVPPPSCDASHLSLCTMESTCNGASGYWYGNACHVSASSNWNEMRWDTDQWQ